MTERRPAAAGNTKTAVLIARRRPSGVSGAPHAVSAHASGGIGGYPHPLAAGSDAPESPQHGAREERRGHEQQDPPATFPQLPPGMRPLLFTAEQAATLLAVRASWLRREAARGTIACTFVGKHLRFSDADLTAIIAHGARGPRPENQDSEPAEAE